MGEKEGEREREGEISKRERNMLIHTRVSFHVCLFEDSMMGR